MSKFIPVHPVNPQTRVLSEAVQVIQDGGVIAYPTDSGYALGCQMGDKDAQRRIIKIRDVGERHNFTLMCADFAQVGPLVLMGNSQFRLVKRLTPGPYTFILEGTKDVPRASLNPKKRTVGIRISDNVVVHSLLEQADGPIVSSSLIMPGDAEPYTDGWSVFEALEHQVDLVLDAPLESVAPTTVIDLTGDVPELIRQGRGDASFLE